MSVGPFHVLCALWIGLLVACSPAPSTPTPTPAPTLTDLPTVAATPTTRGDASVEDILPVADLPPGWRMDGDPRRYDAETLFDFMNGAADLYFTYGFQSLTVGQYVDDEGRALQVEVYRTASDADAYGLFTYNSYGEPLDLGVDGELDSGYRLAFWQSRYHVQIVARETVDDDVLRTFGKAVASTLPGSGQRPALVDALPEVGLAPGSVRFFREKMALDNLLWLGSEDVLGLGPQTQGVVARYERNGQGVDLLLVAYPDAQQALEALPGLQGAGLETLLVSDVRGSTLGAAFGPAASQEAGEALLEQALTANGG